MIKCISAATVPSWLPWVAILEPCFVFSRHGKACHSAKAERWSPTLELSWFLCENLMVGGKLWTCLIAAGLSLVWLARCQSASNPLPDVRYRRSHHYYARENRDAYQWEPHVHRPRALYIVSFLAYRMGAQQTALFVACGALLGRLDRAIVRGHLSFCEPRFDETLYLACWPSNAARWDLHALQRTFVCKLVESRAANWECLASVAPVQNFLHVWSSAKLRITLVVSYFEKTRRTFVQFESKRTTSYRERPPLWSHPIG